MKEILEDRKTTIKFQPELKCFSFNFKSTLNKTKYVCFLKQERLWGVFFCVWGGVLIFVGFVVTRYGDF